MRSGSVKKYLALVFFVIIIIVMIVVLVMSKNLGDEINENNEDNAVLTNNNIQNGNEYYYDEYGNKLSYGDTDLAAEDVIYTYIKALALLDFLTAQKYLYNGSSFVVSGYESNGSSFSGGTSYSLSYNYTHKIYKKMLTSLRVNKIVDTVILQNKQIVTVEVEHLDFNDKEFWLNDKQEIFENMYIYYTEENSESSTSKINEYLSEYIKNKYNEESAPKKIDEVEITLVKGANGAWLLENDSNIYNMLVFNDGSYSINSIKEGYSEWYKNEYRD